MRKREDIVVDKQYEQLTAKKRLPEKLGNEEAWSCECSCGKMTVATKNQLLNGKKLSCGCRRKKKPANALDLTDWRSGLLVARERAGTTEKGQALWKCLCDCGNTAVFTATILRRKEATSCGCQLSEQMENARQTLLDTAIDGVIPALLTKATRSDSRTGVKGVTKRLRKGNVRYEAYITVKGKRHYGPSRKTIEEAQDDRIKLEDKYHKPYLEVKDNE